MERHKIHILVTDVWTDRNKGDAASNVSVIRLLESSFPYAKISVCSSFGANQMDLAIGESFLTRRENIYHFIGGLFPTFHVLDPPEVQRIVDKLFLSVRSVCATFLATFLLFATFLKLEKTFLWLFPHELRRSFEVFLSADMIVSRRNVLGPTSKGLLELYFLFKDFYHPILAVAAKKPLVLVGYSIWPFTNPISRILIRWVMSKSSIVALREELTYRYVEQLGVDLSNVHVVPDISLVTCARSKMHLKPYPRDHVRPSVGFTFVDWRLGGETNRDNYINVMANFIRYVANSYHCKICVVSQVTYPPQNPYAVARLIGSKSGNSTIEYLWKEFSLEELQELYSSFDFVVATPLHSAIFSLAVGTPAILIDYEGGPKHVGVMKMFQMEQNVLPYKGLDLRLLTKLFDKCWLEKSSLHDRALRRVEELRQQLRQFEFLLKNQFLFQWKEHL